METDTYTQIWKETYQDVKCFGGAGRITVIFISYSLVVIHIFYNRQNKPNRYSRLKSRERAHNRYESVLLRYLKITGVEEIKQ